MNGRGFRATYALKLRMSFRESFAYFSRRMLNSIRRVLQQHGLAVEKTELACLQSRPLTNWKHLEHHEKKHDNDKNGTAFLPRKCSSWSPRMSDFYGQLLKEEMLHSGKHGNVPTFCCHKIQKALIFFFQFKHLIHYLICSISKI